MQGDGAKRTGTRPARRRAGCKGQLQHLQLGPLAARDLERDAVGQHANELAAVAVAQLLHPRAVDDRRAVDAEETLGVQALLETLHALAVEVALAADVELDVV